MFEYSGQTRASLKNIPKLSSKIQSLVTGKKHVLDIGCASGWFTHYIDSDASYTGISYSQSDIDVIEKMGHTAHLVNLDTEPLPLPDMSVDLVFISHVVEHFEKAELIALMNECRRVMKDGGVIILMTPTDYHPFFYAEWTHVRPYNHGSLPGLLRDFDFRDVDWTYPALSWLPQKWQALLRFPFFFLKPFLWKEVASWGTK